MLESAHPNRPRGPFRLTYGDLIRDLESEAAVNGALIALPRGTAFHLIDLSCNHAVEVDALGNLQFRAVGVAFSTQDLQDLIGDANVAPISVVSSSAISVTPATVPSPARAPSSGRHSDNHLVRHRPRAARGRQANYVTLFAAVGIACAMGVGMVLVSRPAAPPIPASAQTRTAPTPTPPAPPSKSPETGVMSNDTAVRTDRAAPKLSSLVITKPAASDPAAIPAPSPTAASENEALKPKATTPPAPRTLLAIKWIQQPDSPGLLVAFHQPIRVRAGQPFTVRVDPHADARAIHFRIANTPVHDLRNGGMEKVPPYFLWGDLGGTPNFERLPAGTYPLTITTFADLSGSRTLETYQTTLIAE